MVREGIKLMQGLSRTVPNVSSEPILRSVTADLIERTRAKVSTEAQVLIGQLQPFSVWINATWQKLGRC